MNAIVDEIAQLKERVSFLERLMLRKPLLRAANPGCNTNEELARDAIHFVARRFKMRSSDLTGYCRQMRFVWARWLAIHLIHKHSKLSHSEIGRLFERDHTSIAYALRGVAQEMEIDPVRREQVLQFETVFGRLIGASVPALAA